MEVLSKTTTTNQEVVHEGWLIKSPPTKLWRAVRRIRVHTSVRFFLFTSRGVEWRRRVRRGYAGGKFFFSEFWRLYVLVAEDGDGTFGWNDLGPWNVWCFCLRHGQAAVTAVANYLGTCGRIYEIRSGESIRFVGVYIAQCPAFLSPIYSAPIS